ncbi:MAG: dihydrolipoamide acetyltransferase family protein, partial [Anaerolineae bacterium]
MIKQVVMPTLGLDIEEASITEWLRHEGEAVIKDEPLLVVESDKATMVIEAPETGVLKQILYAPGSVVRVTEAIAYIETEGTEELEVPSATASASSSSVADGEGSAAAAVPSLVQPAFQQAGELERPRASPAARRAARAYGIDLARVSGSGPKGRIQGWDVERFAQTQSETKPIQRPTPLARRLAEERGIELGSVAPSGPGSRIVRQDVLAAATASRSEKPSVGSMLLPGKLVPLSRKRRITAERMTLSVSTVARVTLHSEVDASALVALRQSLVPVYQSRYGVRLSYNAILVRILGITLPRHPYLNARWHEEGVYLIEAVNVGVAMALDDGLVVPVVQHAEQKGLVAIASELERLVRKAREEQLSLDELGGSTFTLTNLGSYGVDAFTPIVNPPEVAILGMGRIVERPVGV